MFVIFVWTNFTYYLPVKCVFYTFVSIIWYIYIYIYIYPCSVHLLFNMLTVIYYISQRAFQIDSNYCVFRTFFTNVCFECILTIMYILNVILLICIYSSANVYSVHILINNQCALLDICSPFTYITHLFFYKQSSIYDLQFNANIVTFSNIFVRSFHIFMYRLHVILRYELQKKNLEMAHCDISLQWSNSFHFWNQSRKESLKWRWTKVFCFKLMDKKILSYSL